MRHQGIGVKESERIYQALRTIRKDATMDTMNLDPHDLDKPVTKLVREKTQIWRESWLLCPLDKILAQMKKRCGFTY